MSPAHAAWLARLRSPFMTVLRVALVIGPLWWLSGRVDVASILRGIEQVGPERLGVAFAIHLCVMAMLSTRWRILLFTYRAQALPSVAYLLRAHLVANYFGLLPIPAADEALRVLRTAPFFPAARMPPYLVLVAERLTGLVGLLLVALLSNLLGSSSTMEISRRVLVLGSFLALLLASLLLAVPELVVRWPRLRERVRAIPLVGEALAQIKPPSRRSDLLWSVLLSVLGQLGWSAAIAVLFAPLDARATLWLCMRVQPLVLLGMSVPATPAGVGQRELLFASLYGLEGVDAADAVTVALLSFALGLAQQALGGVVHAVERLSGLTRATPSKRGKEREPESSTHGDGIR